MGAPGAQIELEGGRLHFSWPGLAQCLDVVARCRLADGRWVESDNWRGTVATQGTTALERAPDAGQHQPIVWEAKSGEQWSGEDLLFAAADDVRRALTTVVVQNPIKKPVPKGWLSWYHFGPWVSADDILANAAQLKNG